MLSELTPGGPGCVSVDRLKILTRNLAQLVSSLTQIWFPLSHAHERFHHEKEGIHAYPNKHGKRINNSIVKIPLHIFMLAD